MWAGTACRVGIACRSGDACRAGTASRAGAACRSGDACRVGMLVLHVGLVMLLWVGTAYVGWYCM